MSTSKLCGWENLQRFSKNRCICYRRESEDQVYTYGDVLDRISEVLALFRGASIVEGTCFILKLTAHTPASCVLILSILQYNCSFHPMSHLQEPLDTFAGYATVTDDDSEPASHDDRREITVFDTKVYLIMQRSKSTSKTSFRCGWAKDICYVMTTSGTSGVPKLVYVPHACIETNVISLSHRLKVGPDDVIYLCAPFSFDPFVVELFLALSNGSCLLITPLHMRLEADKLVAALFPKSSVKLSVTLLQMTPSLFRLLGPRNIKAKILNPVSSLRVLLLGGEEFPSLAEWQTWLPSGFDLAGSKRIFNIYGITEISCWSTLHEVQLSDKAARFPIGEPIDRQTQLKIEPLSDLPVNQGELLIGSSVRKCLLSTDSKSLQLDDGLLFRRTGDIVEKGAENGAIYFVGRRFRIIKRYGNRINLGLVEDEISRLCRGRVQQTVLLWDDEMKKMYCCLRASSELSQSEKQDVANDIAHALSNPKKPDAIVWVNEIPITSHGKVNYGQLLKSMLEGRACPTATATFLNFLQSTLGVDITEQRQPKQSESGKRHRGTMHSTFTDLGGTSYQALSLSIELSQFLPEKYHREILVQLLSPKVSVATMLQEIEKWQLSNVQCKTHRNHRSMSPVQMPTLQLEYCWRAHMKKCVDASGALFDGKYFCIGSHAHILLTLDALSGNSIAKVELPDRIECTVERIADQIGCVGCYDGHLYVFNFVSGEIVQSLQVGGLIKAKPLRHRDAIIVGSYAKVCNVQCISIKTFDMMWQCSVGSKPIFAGPLRVSEDAVLICSLDGTCALLNTCDGTPLWSKQFETPIFATPALMPIQNDKAVHVAIAEVKGTIHICSSKLGATLCTFQANGNIFSSIVVRSGDLGDYHIYFGCHDHSLYCLHYSPRRLTVVLAWKTCLGSAIYATPSLIYVKTGPYIAACTTKGRLTVCALETGRVVAETQVEGEIYSSPIPAGDDKIVFGCRDNFCYCFRIV